jgi:hypothetical protein
MSSLAAILTAQGVVLVACATGIVALARRGGLLATIAFALFATIGCAGALLLVTRSILAKAEITLPPDLMTQIALRDLLYSAVPIAAVSITALLLARRRPCPNVQAHWATALGIGLLAWSMVILASRTWLALDMINASA